MAEKEKLDLGAEKKSHKGLVFVILGSVFLTLAAVFAALYFLGIFPAKDPAGEHGGAVPGGAGQIEQKPVIYLPLSPPFVANFKSNPEARTVQVEISVASSNQSVIDVIKKHSPMLRNHLLLLLSGEDPALLKTAEGKNAFRDKIKATIDRIVLEQTGKNVGVDEVYFTGFIMQ